LLIADLGCDRSFFTYYGRAAWYPLTNIGSIVIEVETKAGYYTRFPLYVEIVALPSPVPQDFCLSGFPGIVVGETYGNAGCGGRWISIGPINLSEILPIGSAYALQLVFFSTVEPKYWSPGVDCVRVTSLSTALPTTWTNAKAIYR
jgi:hypothetical protein